MPTPVAVSPAVSLTLTGRYLIADNVPGAALYGDASSGLLVIGASLSSGTELDSRVGVVEFAGGAAFTQLPRGSLSDIAATSPVSLAGWPHATTPRVAAAIGGAGGRIVLWEKAGSTWAVKASLSTPSGGVRVVSFDATTGDLYAVNSNIGGAFATYLLTPSAGALTAALVVSNPSSITNAGSNYGYGNACVATGKFMLHNGSSTMSVGGPSGSTTWVQTAAPPNSPPVVVNPLHAHSALVYWAPAESPAKFYSADPVTLANVGVVTSDASGPSYHWVGVKNSSASLMAYRNESSNRLDVYSTADTSDFQTIAPLTGTTIMALGGGALAVFDNYYDASPLLRVYPYIVAPAPTDRVVDGAVGARVGAVGQAISGENGIRLNAVGALSAVATVAGTRGPSTSVAYGAVGAQIGIDAFAGAPAAGTAIAATVSVTGVAQVGQVMRGGISAAAGGTGTAAGGRRSSGSITAVAALASTGRTLTVARGAAAVVVGAAAAVRATTSAAGSLGVLVTAAGTRGTGTTASGVVSAAAGAAAVARLGTRASGRAAVAASAAGRIARVRIRRGYLMGPYVAMARHTIDAVGYTVVDGTPVALGAGTLGLDGAACMAAALTTRSSDFGDPRAKNVPVVWLDADLSADAVLTASNEQRSDTYPVPYVATALTTRVTLGRGSQGRYWQLKVQGQSGALRLRALEAIGGSKPTRRTK